MVTLRINQTTVFFIHQYILCIKALQTYFLIFQNTFLTLNQNIFYLQIGAEKEKNMHFYMAFFH
jgi:hypothetical protein